MRLATTLTDPQRAKPHAGKAKTTAVRFWVGWDSDGSAVVAMDEPRWEACSPKCCNGYWSAAECEGVPILDNDDMAGELWEVS